MNDNKKLKKIANEKLSEYSNEDLKQRLKTGIKHEENENNFFLANRKLLKRCAVSFACVLVLIAVALIQPSLWNSQSTAVGSENEADDDYTFGYEDIVSRDATFEELNADTKYLNFNFECNGENSYFSNFLGRKRRQTLYYDFRYTSEEGEAFTVIVITNERYNYKFNYDYKGSTAEVCGFTLEYKVNEVYEDELYFYDVYGKITTDKEIVYYMFNSIEFEQGCRFLEYVQRITFKKT